MSKLKRALVFSGAFLAAIVATVAIAATPASASYSECLANEACLFDGHNGADPLLIYYTSGWAHSGCQNLPPSINDRTSSAINRFPSGDTISFYQNINCGGGHFDLPAGQAVDLGAFSDNQASSLYFH